jgi:hypothetical protein
MTLATKNGSLIVKDGKIAENCGCCGDWYCYCEDDCNTTPACSYCLGSCPPHKAPNSFTATIAASDYINRVMGKVYYDLNGRQGLGVGLVSYFKGSAISGTHTMSRVSATEYRVDLPSSADCSASRLGGSYLLFNMSACFFQLRVRRLHESSLANFPADTPPKAVGDLDCTSQEPPAGFLTATANPQWVYRNGPEGANGGGSIQTTILPVSCSQINSTGQVAMSMTLPESWWSEGSFVGFGFTSFPGFAGPGGYVSDPVVFQQSGSRNVSISIAPNY